jgi:TolB protein
MLTELEGGACQPAWAPDGKRLVFTSPCDENARHYNNAHLFVIRADGTGLVALPTFQRGEYAPDWSPDGQTIIFTAVQDDYRHQIYALSLQDESIEKISDGEAWDFHPTYSTDGSQIAFISTRSGPSQVWVMDANGENARRFSRSKDLENSYPDWSPDGSVLLYTQRSNGFPILKRALYAEDGYHEDNVYEGYAPMQEGMFSPDGKWIVLESWPTEETNHDIYLYNLDNGDFRRLTEASGHDFDPAWRPVQP